jgi:DNA polymerase III gamma/tau subunit
MTGGKPDAASAQRLLGLSSHNTLADVVEAAERGDAPALLHLVDDLVNRGRSLERFVKGLLAFLHDVMLLQSDPRTALVSLTGDALGRARDLSRKLGQAAVFNMMNQLFELEDRMRRSTQTRFLVEFALLRMAAIKPVVPIDDILNKLRALPSANAPAPASAPARDAQAAGARTRSHLDSQPAPAFRDASPPESEPDAAPPRPSPGSGSRDELEGLDRDALIERIGSRLPDAHRFLARYFRQSLSMRVQGGSLSILWPRDERVGSRMIARPENKKVIEATLTAMAGRAMTIQTSFSSESAPPTPAEAPPEGAFHDADAYDGEPEPESFSPRIEDEGNAARASAPPIEVSFASRAVDASASSESKAPPTPLIDPKSLLAANTDLARRARMVRDFFDGAFVDPGDRTAV